jgi:hypothetical protein
MARYPAVIDEGMQFRNMAEVIGLRLGVSVVSKSTKNAFAQLAMRCEDVMSQVKKIRGTIS